METVPLSTGASSSSSRLLVRRANTPWRPEQEQVHRPWALVGPGVCLSAAWLRRHQRRAAGQAEAAKPKSSSWGQLPCWGVAIFGLLLVIVHRLILQKCRLHLPPTRFTVFLHASLFLTMSQVLPPSKFPQEQNVKLVLLVGVLEFLGWASLQKVAVAGGLGVSAALLSGVSLMLTLASAQVLLKSRVRSSAWVGATLVALGVGALGPVHALTALLSHATSLLLLCASLGTTSLALTGKEVLFSGRAPLSVASVASLASFAQLLALAVPEMLRLHSFPGTLEMAQIIIGPAPRIAHLSWVAYAYILGSAALRYTFTWALRAANAPTVQLMNALAVPLGQILLMLTSNVALSWHSLASLGLCAVGSVIFFLEEGPLVKASELFKGTMSEHQLRLEEAWKKQKAEKEKKAQEERERQKKLAQEREEKNKKEREVAEKQRLAKQQALQKEREEKEKQKEEERKKQEAERQKVAAEKKRLQEEQKAKKAEEKKKAEEERLKKQQEYQRMKQEEEKKAIAEKERKEAEKKQQAEAKQREREAQQKAKEEKRKQQELLAEQKKAEAAKKKEAEQKRQAEDAKKAQEMKQAEEERKRKEQEEKKKKQEEEAAQKKEAERQRQLAEEQTKQMEAEKKEKEEADRKRKEEEQKAKAEQKAEAERKRQEEERKRQEEERKRQEEERKQKQDEEGKPKQEVAAEAKDLDQKKRFERLSFKWKMQDEMRLGQETAKIKKQLQEREEELAKLRESKEEEARRWKELEEEARKIEEEKTKAFQKKR